MSSKSDRFYFENFTAAADCACRAASYLVECLASYQPEKLPEMLNNLHAIEHEGDGKKHEMSAALAKAFVTPIDREDIDMLSHNIDDVTDMIEEVLQYFYMDSIGVVPTEAIEFAKKIEQCSEMLRQIMQEFGNFKRSTKLHEMIVDLSNAEEECDKFYLLARASICRHCSDPLEIISWREIYDRMEDCADACEHVGDCVETVIMKNT